MTPQIVVLPAASILIPSDRQRKGYDQKHINALTDSIREGGLIHSLHITDSLDLISGGCRREAVLGLNAPYRYGDSEIPAGHVPCLIRSGLSEVQITLLELDENLRRKNLTPAEEAAAVAKLHRLKEQENPGNWTKGETAAAVTAIRQDTATSQEVADSLLIDQYRDDPDIQKATSRAEAVKAAKKKMADLFGSALSNLTVLKSEDYILHEGNCLEIMQALTPSSFAGIVTDPPYGVDADSFGEQSFGHNYTDDEANAFEIAEAILGQGFNLCKEDAHLYMFCDIRYWLELADICRASGWRPYATPIIWHKPNAGHAPQVGYFTRRYEAILFAQKGSRRLSQSSSDVWTFNAVQDKVHAAQKPVEVIHHALKLSFFPGETILDPCAGRGTIFEAAKLAGLRATGIEVEATSIALCKQTIGAL